MACISDVTRSAPTWSCSSPRSAPASAGPPAARRGSRRARRRIRRSASPSSIRLWLGEISRSPTRRPTTSAPTTGRAGGRLGYNNGFINLAGGYRTIMAYAGGGMFHPVSARAVLLQPDGAVQRPADRIEHPGQRAGPRRDRALRGRLPRRRCGDAARLWANLRNLVGPLEPGAALRLAWTESHRRRPVFGFGAPPRRFDHRGPGHRSRVCTDRRHRRWC